MSGDEHMHSHGVQMGVGYRALRCAALYDAHQIFIISQMKCLIFIVPALDIVTLLLLSKLRQSQAPLAHLMPSCKSPSAIAMP
jgi:hypothetical protein